MINVLVSVHFLRNLPLIDFRPYTIGTHIPSAMEIPEGMPVDEYETILVYEKEGARQEFTLQSPEQPWSDSSWNWIETRNVLVKEGFKPPIHDFSLTSLDGIDITDQLLYDAGYSFLIVAYDLEKSSKDALAKIKILSEQAIEKGYSIYGMTSSVDEVIGKISVPFDYNFEFYTSDDITLKTMIRSNPGVLLIKDGIILGKWSGRNLPEKDLFENNALSKNLSKLQVAKSNGTAIIAVLFFALVGILTTTFRLYLYKE